jgi:FMN phosphatase YigB (HAD superfamily)
MRWVFWDIGDTLLNEDPLRFAIWKRLHQALHDAGSPVTFASLMDTRERLAAHGDSSPHYTIARKQLSVENYDVWRSSLAQFVPGDGQQLIHPIEGIIGVLRSLSDTAHLGIIADQPPSVRDTLDRHGMLDMFGVVVLSATVGYNKPDVSIYTEALSQAGCDADDAVMVGNRYDMDIAPANRLGMGTVFCYLSPDNKGRQPESDEEAAYHMSLGRVPNWPTEPDPGIPTQQPDAVAGNVAELSTAIKYALGR